MSGEAARQFKIELSKEWVEKLREVRESIPALGLQGFKRVIEKSPADTGRFIGNWSLTIGEISTATKAQTPAQLAGVKVNKAIEQQAAISAGTVAAKGYPDTGFPAIHIQNNLPYAVPLEDGHSKQAPGGMVALTVAELQTMFEGDI